MSIESRFASSTIASVLIMVLISPILPLHAAVYYVDTIDGNDANVGTTPQAAWKTLNAANNRVQGTGDDLLLRSGSVFEDQMLRVDWSGSESDWVVVDCYDLVNGKAVSCSKASTYPEINGSFEEDCAGAGRCAISSPGAVPGDSYAALVSIVSSYVQVRQIRIKDSAGIPLVVRGSKGNPISHFVLEDLDISHSVRSVLQVGNGVRDGVIRRVHGYQFGLCEKYKYDVCSGSGWPGGVVVHDSPHAMVLMADNLVHDGYGEGFNCLRSSHVIMRGNRAGSLHSNPYYVDQCSNTIVEGNIAWGDLSNEWQSNAAFGGINVSTEYYQSNVSDAVNNIVRNNLITGVGHCLFAAQWAKSAEAGLKIGFHAYGNTCIQMRRGEVFLSNTIQNVDRIVVQNNIFFSPGASQVPCKSPAKAGISFEGNLWATTADSVCRSNSDLMGDPMLHVKLEEFSRFNSQRQPSAKDFALKSGSPVIGRGTKFQSTTLAEFANSAVGNQVWGDANCSLSLLTQAVDFFCVPRSSPPSIGAIDRLRYPPQAPSLFEG